MQANRAVENDAMLASLARAFHRKRYASRGMDMKWLAATCLFSMFFCVSSANAKDYCQPMPKAQKEADPWYIPESAFTKDAANKALRELNSQINKGVKGRDFLVDNELKMIKGYLYRIYLAEHEKEFRTEDSSLRKEFCSFLHEKAYVSH